MTRYLQTHLGLDENQADRLRVHYWRRYGATLPGLIRHHGTNPRHFLWHTHRFSCLPGLLLFEPGLGAMLRRLPGRKIIFSNAPQHYVHEVLDILRITRLFETVFAIEQIGFRPKPDPHGYYRLLRAKKLSPENCIMVEDCLDNLRTAKKLGMRTVWIHPENKRASSVDVRIKSVLDLPKVAYKLRRGVNSGTIIRSHEEDRR
jgi:putative hydrolase of the HAD superfamily